MSPIGNHNAVRGCPGWHYGLFVTSREEPLYYLPVVRFDIIGPNGESVERLRASGYRTTTLARKMGERELRGYEHEARLAIKARQP